MQAGTIRILDTRHFYPEKLASRRLHSSSPISSRHLFFCVPFNLFDVLVVHFDVSGSVSCSLAFCHVRFLVYIHEFFLNFNLFLCDILSNDLFVPLWATANFWSFVKAMFQLRTVDSMTVLTVNDLSVEACWHFLVFREISPMTPLLLLIFLQIINSYMWIISWRLFVVLAGCPLRGNHQCVWFVWNIE